MKVFVYKKALIYACGVLLLAVVGFLGFITVPGADDYWYSTFFYNGLRNYFDLLIFHYQTFNGRVLVHIPVQIALGCGNWLVGLLHVLTLFGIGFLALKNIKRKALACIGMTLIFAGVLLLPTSMYVDGIMWTSAFFNYILPVLMIVGLVNLLHKYESKTCSKGQLFVIGIYAFLCGATTEQAGAASVAVAALYCAYNMLKSRSLKIAGLISFITGILGLCSIFLSPATQARAVSEMGKDAAGLLVGSIKIAGKYFFSNPQLFVMIILFFLVWGAYLAFIKSQKKYFLPGIGLAAVIFITNVILGQTYALCVSLVAVSIAAAALVFFTDTREIGYYLTAGLVCISVILFTQTIEPRTLLPFFLYLLIAIALMLTIIIGERLIHGTIVVALFTALALVFVLPSVAKHWHNYQTELENLSYAEEARSSGVLRISDDYYDDYTSTKMYMDGYFFEKYLEYLRIDRNTTEIQFICENGYRVYLNGEEIKSYPGFYDDKTYRLPLRYIVEYYGGTVEYTNQVTTILFKGKLIEFRGDEIRVTDKGEDAGFFDAARTIRFSVSYLPHYFFEQCLGMEINVDDDLMEVYVEHKR